MSTLFERQALVISAGALAARQHGRMEVTEADLHQGADERGLKLDGLGLEKADTLAKFIEAATLQNDLAGVKPAIKPKRSRK